MCVPASQTFRVQSRSHLFAEVCFGLLFGLVPPAPWLTNDQLVQRLGADAVIDYRQSEDEQLQDLKAITGGNFFGVFDTVAKFTDWSLKALREASTAEKKHFATTNDWYVK
jgi:hypothetical protein